MAPCDGADIGPATYGHSSCLCCRLIRVGSLVGSGRTRCCDCSGVGSRCCLDRCRRNLLCHGNVGACRRTPLASMRNVRPLRGFAKDVLYLDDWGHGWRPRGLWLQRWRRGRERLFLCSLRLLVTTYLLDFLLEQLPLKVDGFTLLLKRPCLLLCSLCLVCIRLLLHLQHVLLLTQGGSSIIISLLLLNHRLLLLFVARLPPGKRVGFCFSLVLIRVGCLFGSL